MLSCAASFDCVNAGTKVEKMICSNADVSVMDEQLTEAYKKAMETVSDKEALKKQQVKWLKEIRNKCLDYECLVQAYPSQVELLKASSGPSLGKQAVISLVHASAASTVNSKKPMTFKLVYGDSYPICKPYVDMLNAAKYTEYPACERKILPEFSQFKAINWRKIENKQEMKQIIDARLNFNYMYYGDDRKDMLIKEKNEINKLIDTSELKMYSFLIDIEKDGKNEELYKTIVDFSWAENANLCNKHNNFYVKNSNFKIENAKVTYSEPYASFNFDGNNDLFIFNETIYSSNWSGVHKDEHAEIDVYSSVSDKICGIKIQ